VGLPNVFCMFRNQMAMEVVRSTRYDRLDRPRSFRAKIAVRLAFQVQLHPVLRKMTVIRRCKKVKTEVCLRE
jgi:hypothetical protein